MPEKFLHRRIPLGGFPLIVCYCAPRKKPERGLVFNHCEAVDAASYFDQVIDLPNKKFRDYEFWNERFTGSCSGKPRKAFKFYIQHVKMKNNVISPCYFGHDEDLRICYGEVPPGYYCRPERTPDGALECFPVSLDGQFRFLS